MQIVCLFSFMVFININIFVLKKSKKNKCFEETSSLLNLASRLFSVCNKLTSYTKDHYYTSRDYTEESVTFSH